jgi:hypothetical protein
VFSKIMLKKSKMKVTCRDPTKVMLKRLFEFHRNLFTLGFTMEKPVANAVDDDFLGEVIEERKRRNGGNETNGNEGMDTYGRTGEKQKK